MVELIKNLKILFYEAVFYRTVNKVLSSCSRVAWNTTKFVEHIVNSLNLPIIFRQLVSILTEDLVLLFKASLIWVDYQA